MVYFSSACLCRSLFKSLYIAMAMSRSNAAAKGWNEVCHWRAKLMISIPIATLLALDKHTKANSLQQLNFLDERGTLSFVRFSYLVIQFYQLFRRQSKVRESSSCSADSRLETRISNFYSTRLGIDYVFKHSNNTLVADTHLLPAQQIVC